MKPLVAIVGRPNVGKSTLFNRIVGRRQAIVQDEPGVTRDRHYADCEWAGHKFLLVDTGGFEPDAEDELRAGMRRQAEAAVEEAQAVIFLVDAVAGLTGADEEIAESLRRSDRPVLVAANKIDSDKREAATDLAELYGLGFDVQPVSAEHGRYISDLLDWVVEASDAPLADESDDIVPEGTIRMCIVGRPNVGKSTLCNKLLGEERFLATDVPGTTRDSLDAELRYQGKTFRITDTAGLRRRRSIDEDVERYSATRSIKTIERSDVVVLVLDSSEPGVAQDARLASLALARGRAVIVVANKWDLRRDEGDEGDAVRKEVMERLPEAGEIPLLLVSALEGKRVFSVLEAVAESYEVLNSRVPTPVLNEWLESVVAHRSPPMVRGRVVRMLYASQIGTAPPKILVSTNRPEDIPEDYKRFMINRFREDFGFGGVPIRLAFKSRRGKQRGKG